MAARGTASKAERLGTTAVPGVAVGVDNEHARFTPLVRRAQDL
jgi:hypothetical protein